MLFTFYEIFGLNFFKNLSIIITRWSQSKTAIEERIDENISEIQKCKDYNEALIELNILKKEDKQIKCFFINNMLGKNIKNEEKLKTYE